MLKTRLRFKDKNAFTAASRSIANGSLKGLCAAQGKANHSIHPKGSSSNSVELCWAPHSFLLAGDGVDSLRQRPNIATRQENANPASWNDIFADSSHFVLSFSFACQDLWSSFDFTIEDFRRIYPSWPEFLEVWRRSPEFVSGFLDHWKSMTPKQW